jgi:sugar phosphate isomerase/epimerase
MNSLELCAAIYTIAGDIKIGDPFPPSMYSFRELCEAAGAAGYSGIGLLHTDYERARESGLQPRDLRAILADNGLRHFEMEFLGGWYASGEALASSKQAEETFFRAADEVGVRYIKGGAEVGDFTRPIEYVRDRFAELADRAVSHGTRVALEPSPFSSIRDLDTALAVVGGAGEGGGLLFDIWHVTRCGIPFESLSKVPIERIFGVEIDDARREVVGDLWTDTIDNRLLPGDGDFDIAGFVRAIDAAGFAGPISVEVLNKDLRKRPLSEVARLTFSRSKAALERARASGPSEGVG